MKRYLLIVTIVFAFPVQNTFCQETNCEIAQRNKKIVVEFYQKLFGDKDISVIDEYISEDYIQHNPVAADGRQALKDIANKWLSNQPKTKVDFQKVAADGDLVFLHIKSKSSSGKDLSLIDIFRLKDGKIVEHWDIMQEVPEKSANPHPMF
jgi:predicted SnoaL-like aldol condensation-catalyzing enzyme